MVRLEADQRGDARSPVPVLDRPPPGQGHRRQPGIGVERVGMADGVEQGEVEDAVGVGVRGGEVDARLARPPTGRRRACRCPRRTDRRDGRCSARPDSRSGWRSPRRNRGHRPAARPGRPARWWRGPTARPSARWPASAAEGPGLDQIGERLDGPLAGPPGGVDRAAPHDPGRGPGQADEGDRLPEPVVEAVDEAVPGQAPPRWQDPFGHHGLLQDRAAGRAQQGPVEVDEDGGRRSHEHATAGTRQVGGGITWRTAWPATGTWRPTARRTPDAAKGLPRGEGSPFALTQQG